MQRPNRSKPNKPNASRKTSRTNTFRSIRRHRYILDTLSGNVIFVTDAAASTEEDFLRVLCVSDMFGGVIDENAFTAPIHVELSQAPPPLWQPAQPAGAQHLALGRLLAKAGKTNEALAEYAKAVDSDNAPTRASAMAGSEELLTWQSRLQDWIQDRLALIWIAGFNIVIAIVLFFLAERLASCIGYLVRISRRKNSPPRLEIEPLSYWPSTEKPYTHFREIANFVRERMSKQYLLKQKIKISQEATVLPTIDLETALRACEPHC